VATSPLVTSEDMEWREDQSSLEKERSCPEEERSCPEEEQSSVEEERSPLQEIQDKYGLKLLGPSYRYALVCLTCKVLHPLDSLKSHWRHHHSSSKEDITDRDIGVLRRAGACWRTIPVPEKRVLAIPSLKDAQDGYWCSTCCKAAPKRDTIRLSEEHGQNRCPGIVAKTLVQRINLNHQYWAVYQHQEMDGSVDDESEEQVEEEMQHQDELVNQASNLEEIRIINNRNVGQFVRGTEWLDLLGTRRIKPIRGLVELPTLRERNGNDCRVDYPALCSLLEEYVESLLRVLDELPRILRQHLATTNG